MKDDEWGGLRLWEPSDCAVLRKRMLFRFASSDAWRGRIEKSPSFAFGLILGERWENRRKQERPNGVPER